MPTVSVSIDGVHPRAAAEALGRDGIYVWDGDFYATGLIERLGKAEAGGVLRLGLVHYNTAAEVDRTLEALARIAGGRRRDRPVTEPIDPGDGSPAASTRPSCAGSSGCGSATRSPRTARDIDGLIATLAPRMRLRDRPDRPALGGPRRRPAFYTELFGAFPDNAFALSEIVVGPQGVFEVATLTGTNQGPWAGVAAVRAGRSRSRSSSCSPGTPSRNGSLGERIWFDRGAL